MEAREKAYELRIANGHVDKFLSGCPCRQRWREQLLLHLPLHLVLHAAC